MTLMKRVTRHRITLMTILKSIPFMRSFNPVRKAFDTMINADYQGVSSGTNRPAQRVGLMLPPPDKMGGKVANRVICGKFEGQLREI